VLSATDAGEKLQAASAGSPEHDNVIVASNPPLGVSVSVDTAEAPAATEPEAGLAVIAKSAEAPVTVRLIALDRLLPKVVLGRRRTRETCLAKL
jgi:hypothetical protein